MLQENSKSVSKAPSIIFTKSINSGYINLRTGERKM